MTPLSKKACWLLMAIISVTALASFNYEWAPLIIASVGIFIVILLSGMDLLNNLFFFSIPLSIELSIPGLGSEIIFPSEPIAVVVFSFTVINMIAHRKLFRLRDYQPATGALLLLWLALCYATCTSNLPIVSIKSLVIFTLYLTTFYLQWFVYADPKEALPKIDKAIRYYFAGLLIVCLFTTYKHASFGFMREMAMRVPPPFFSDHTIYGTCLAFFVPMIYYWIKTSHGPRKFFYLFAFTLFILAIFSTYSRAVWMSLIVVLITYYLLKIKIDIQKLMAALAFFLIVFLLFQQPVVELLSQNHSDSKSRKAEVTDQLKSVGNISTDVSNLERINRWKSAWSMFNDKPWSGHGPGTYQFNFIPYQRAEDKTPISVNYASDHFSQGKGGTAHSQYLLYASESGLFALMAFVACILYTVKEAFQLYHLTSDEKEKLYIKALLGGYITFVFHSFFNNFLDIDKAASLFFTFNAAIVLLTLEKKRSILHHKTKQTNGR